MMMKVRTTEFDGTPEEFLRVAHLFGTQSPIGPQGPESAEVVPSSSTEAEITPQMVERVLTRRPLSRDMKKVLKVLLAAGPAGLPTTEIAQAVGISNAELSGVFGAFGRRVANTPGWPRGVAFITRTRDDEHRNWRSLPDIARQVLESGRVKL
jgi:hypothetical protein